MLQHFDQLLRIVLVNRLEALLIVERHLDLTLLLQVLVQLLQ